MPISPYYGHNAYGARNYVRSNSSSNLAGMGSYYSPVDTKSIVSDHPADYFRSKYIIPEEGPAKSYLSPRYNQTPRSGFQLKRLDSSDNLYERRNPLEENRLQKSTSTSSFLTSNTPSYLKSNNSSEGIGRSYPYSPTKTRTFASNLPSPTEATPPRPQVDRKFAGRCAGESSYARAYLARINKEREDRPREIDTRDINTSVPRTPKWLKTDKSEDDGGNISRNRQVVRLTIKREKPEPQDPFTIKNKTLQTIAQRLINKYQVPEKKPDPPEPKKAEKKPFYRDVSPPRPEKARPTRLNVTSKAPVPSASSAPATPVSTVPQDSLPPKLPSMTFRGASGAVERAPISVEGDKKEEDMSLILQRATETAETKKELESWQEVKDAIVAVVLHPDVDIESDEEINKLIEGEPQSSSGSEVTKVKVEEQRRDSMDKGLAIVGQLKRYVKKQESSYSTKRRSKKHSGGSQNSKKRKEGVTTPPNDDITVPKTTESSQEQIICAPAYVEASIEEKQKEKALTSERDGGAFERIEESKPAGNTTSVEKEQLGDSSARKWNKAEAEKEKPALSPSLPLGNEAAHGNDATKAISGHTEKTPGKSMNNCNRKEKTKSLDASFLLSPDVVLDSQGPKRQELVTEDSSTCNDNTELQHKQTKGEKSTMKPDVKEETKDVSGTKIPKIKKKMKTSAAAVKEVSGDALRPSGTRAAPPSSLPLLSSSSASPAQLPPTQDALRETHKKQSRDTPVLARTTDTQAPDRQMESPSALETLKSIMREEVECAAAKDSPTGGKTMQVTAGNSTSDAATDLETSRVGGSCLTPEHKNEKAVKVESSEHLEAAEKDLDAKKLNSPASKQEAGEKTADGGKKEIKTLKEQKETKNNKAKDSAASNQTEAAIDRDKKADGIKPEAQAKLSAIPRWMTKDKKAVNEENEEMKPKDISKIMHEKDSTSHISKNSEIKSSLENKDESKEKAQNSNHDTSKITAAIKEEKHEGESDNKGQTGDRGERGRDKEDVMSLKGNAKPTQAVSEVAGPEGGAPPNTLPVKRVLKRPRQVAPPPVSEKDTTNELLKARNILKRPVKPGTATTPTEIGKEDAANVAEITTKPAWKKPTSQSAPSNQGDQLGQAKNVLKKPEKPKEEERAEKQAEAASEVKPKKLGNKALSGTAADTQVNEGGKDTRGRVVRKQRPAYSRSASSSSSSGEEEGSTVRKKPGKPKKITSPISDAKKTPSPKGDSESPLVPETTPHPETPPGNVAPPVPEASLLKKTTAQLSGEELAAKDKQESGDGRAATSDGQVVTKSTSGPGIKAGPQDSSVMATVVLERKVGVQTGAAGAAGAQESTVGVSQSADSGYGSSPSTPLPTPAPAAPLIKDEEEKCPVCGTNCHKKCEKQMPNLCGVNQKLLAEALSSVKKGGSTDGTLRTPGTPPKASSSSASVSGSEAESTEEETETTDTDNDFFGPPEIRPPLQTCPKFKKYNVDDFQFIKVLGKGSYGKVMLAKQAGTENYFAVKCLKKDVVLEDNDVECTLIERKVLSLGTKHPYLCHLFCTFQTPSHLFFVMEYLTGGDLMFHIQHCGRFDEFRACFYGAEITSGLKFLHGKGIIYRDLKLDNILLDYQGHIRIADFGMCKLQVYLDRYADTFCGTPDYMAPEVIKGQHYNQCVDWWSFGVLLYEMLTGKSPFKGCDEDHLFWLICNDEPFYPKFLSKEATSILKQLLDKDSSRRLGIPFSPYGEITVHPFFKYIDWNKIERKEVETPYKPRLRHILDVQYFDPLFTKRQAGITPIDESILATMDQKPFKDFSYTNPNITD